MALQTRGEPFTYSNSSDPPSWPLKNLVPQPQSFNQCSHATSAIAIPHLAYGQVYPAFQSTHFPPSFPNIQPVSASFHNDAIVRLRSSSANAHPTMNANGFLRHPNATTGNNCVDGGTPELNSQMRSSASGLFLSGSKRMVSDQSSTTITTPVIVPYTHSDVLERWVSQQAWTEAPWQLCRLLRGLQLACSPAPSCEGLYDLEFLLTVQILSRVRLGLELPKKLQEIEGLLSASRKLSAIIFPVDFQGQLAAHFLSRFPCENISSQEYQGGPEWQSHLSIVTLFFRTFTERFDSFIIEVQKTKRPPTSVDFANNLNIHSELLQQEIFLFLYHRYIDHPYSPLTFSYEVQKFEATQASFFGRSISSIHAPHVLFQPLSQGDMKCQKPLTHNFPVAYRVTANQSLVRHSPSNVARNAKVTDGVTGIANVNLEDATPEKRTTSPKEVLEKRYQFAVRSMKFPDQLSPEFKTYSIHFQIPHYEYNNKLSNVLQDWVNGEGKTLRFRLSWLQKISNIPDAEDAEYEPFWPQHVYFTLNSHCLIPYTRFHYEKDTPLDITEYVQAGQNKLQVTSNLTKSKSVNHILVIETLESVTYEKIKTTVLGSSRTMSSLGTLPIPQEGSLSLDLREGVENESSNVKINVTLLDYTSGLLPEIPIRGKNCKHYNCFDFDTFLQNQPCNFNNVTDPKAWKCPICGAEVTPNLIVVDKYMNCVRKQLEKQNLWGKVEAISVDESSGRWCIADGATWDAKHVDHTNSFQLHEGAPLSVKKEIFVVDDLERDELRSPNQQRNRIICLDDE